MNQSVMTSTIDQLLQLQNLIKIILSHKTPGMIKGKAPFNIITHLLELFMTFLEVSWVMIKDCDTDTQSIFSITLP